MNISTIGLQNTFILGRGSTTRRFNLSINTETARLTGGTRASEVNTSSLSISSAAKALLEQSKKKNYEEPISSSEKHSSSDSVDSREVERLKVSHDTIYISQAARLHDALFYRWHTGCDSTRARKSFTNMARMYKTIRQELKAELEGEELQWRLKKLSEDFENELQRAATSMRYAIITAAFYGGREAVEDVFYQYFGIRPSLGNNFTFDSADSLANTIRDFIIQIGLIVRQFVLEHGSTFSTGEELSLAFVNHIKNNTNAMNGFSSLFSPTDLASIML